ncbi:MAG: helix-turn-helix transcriptional regulator [Bacteroidetes Order II. Incertae sedis bacterium]|nr:helix-turn-helix transcriptional regulator [Bacteroidetes Order II. bacterium]
MIFQMIVPKEPLGDFVESILYYKDFHPTHQIDRFLPDGNVNLLIELTGKPQPIYDNQSLKILQTCTKTWFSGIRTQPISIPSGFDIEMVVVTFRKGRAYPFTDMPLHELTDKVVEADLVLGNHILSLREALLEVPDPLKKLKAVEDFLKYRFRRRFVPNECIHFAVRSVLSLPEPLTLERLSQKVGYSQKHLIKLFKDHVGLTPKAFMKVSRFQQIIHQIEQSSTIHWAELALDTGYYDQAHFIHDFRHFSGFTPAQYLALKRDMLNYVPVG